MIAMLLLSFSANAADAFNTTVKALYKVPSVKYKIDGLSDDLIRKIPIEDETAILVGSVAKTLIDRKISARNINFLGGNLKTDLTYNFDDNSVQTYAICVWSFN